MNTIGASGGMAPQVNNPTADGAPSENAPIDSVKIGGLRTRILSALVLAPMVLGLTYLGGAAFNGMLLIAAVLMAYEWNRMCCGGGGATGVIIILAVLAGVGVAAGDLAEIALVVTVLAAGLTYAVTGAIVGFSQRRPLWLVAGVLYIALPCIAVIWLRAAPETGLAIILWLLGVIWATDIGAYFAGRGIGGPRLAPRISPKKTWSGLVGGMLAAGAVGAATANLLGWPNAPMLIAFSIGLAVVAQAGDLAESAIKRAFKVKDSSQLIPGHGGLLDRLDGLMAAAPSVAAVALMGGEGVLAWR